MTCTIHQIGAARKRRLEANEVMHLVNEEKSPKNPGCPGCRVCSICGEECCNASPGLVDDRWTHDHETWALHTNPCTDIPIIGATK